MSSSARARLLALLGNDAELHRLLCESGFVPREEQALAAEHLELARVAHTLISELEVNWPGVEVVLRMRSELLETQRQVAELLRLLHERSR
jgi:hypothetical protein